MKKPNFPNRDHSTRDTDWDNSQKGNYWRRLNGSLLIVGYSTKTKKHWARCDQDFARGAFESISDAMFAAEQMVGAKKKEDWWP
jgi:hypothetical protein